MRILVLAPHTDDESAGAGGSIARWAEEGHEIFCAAFSPCIESIPEGFKEDATRKELRAACSILGIDKVRLYDYPVRHFPEHRQAVLEDMISLRKTFKPRMVLAPSSWDYHQDHQVIHRETRRAFRGATILGYDMPRNCQGFDGSVYVPLESVHLSRKIQALLEYKSQVWRGGLNHIEGLAQVRGAQAGCEIAEAFEGGMVIWDQIKR